MARDREPRADSKQRKAGEGNQTSEAGDTGHLSLTPLPQHVMSEENRERLQARVGPKHTIVHGPPTGHACARGSTCVPVFNRLNNPRRSTSPGFSDKETQRLNHLPADSQLGAGGSKPALSRSVTVLSVTELF